MPRNGSGTYTLPAGNPVVTGTTISSTVQNNTTSDIATALTNSLAKDGQTTPTANLPMGTFRHTGVGDGVARTDYTALGQTQDGLINWVDSGGTADAITATYTPVVTTLSDGQLFYVRAGFANATTTPTFSPNSLTARTIVKNGGVALAAGDIVGNGHELILRYDLTGTRYELLNPGTITNATNATNLTGSGTISSTTTATTQSLSDNSTKVATTAYVDRAAREVINSISASVAANALTISASALTLDFRSATLGSGTVTTVNGTPADLVISSGSTLGTVNAVQSDIAVLAMNNAGTIELAAVNIAGGVDLSETGIISTTAEGGAGAADSATVIYSTTARSNLAYRVIGIIRSTQATAGTWATAPSLLQGQGGNALSSMMSMGYGQTWQSVTRNSGTTYYNTTGRPITLMSTGLGSSTTDSYITISINGGTAFRYITSYFTGGGNGSGNVVIPAGASYVLTYTGFTGSTTHVELR